VSYRDRPSNGSAQHIGCMLLGSVLLLINFFVFATWYFSFWDLSTDTYRPVVFLDFVIVPGTVVGSFLLLRFYLKKFL
jgi:hypothetical protein